MADLLDQVAEKVQRLAPKIPKRVELLVELAAAAGTLAKRDHYLKQALDELLRAEASR